jgi:tripeptidyl-peptidase-2
MSANITFIDEDDIRYIKTCDNRKIIINKNWINPTGLYRHGIKRAYDLYPTLLEKRVKSERKKNSDAEYLIIESNLYKQLNDTSLTSDEIDDIKIRLNQLKSIVYDDSGPILDCIVWHDGERFQSAIDTSETGDLSNKEAMTNYRVSYQFEPFSNIDSLNYTVNIYDNGDILSINCDAGAHGSHVAGIVSAYHPNQVELNGIAPGAQIISLKIGDSRLGSMETGVGLTRAIIEAVKRKCDIINMSYGESTQWDNQGQFVELANKMVNKHGIIFVASAGNNGPALSTVGCPGGTSSCAISVAACVTRSLMSVAYSMTDKIAESNYTWSSVGPSLDGDLGVNIIAPGGAVTSVPNWTLSRNQLMNGTSMSSPNATGCIALLLSGLKANNLPISPIRVRRCVENSAKLLDNVNILGQGNGLIQVAAAWKLLQNSFNLNGINTTSLINSSNSSSIYNENDLMNWYDVGYNIKCNSERFERGIYLRQPYETSIENTFKVNISPQFKDGTPNEVLYNYEVRMNLVASHSWVTCPDHMLMTTAGKVINVVVDPTKLPPGQHVCIINCYMERDYNMNDDKSHTLSLIDIPITVIKPDMIPEGITSLSCDYNLESSERYRRFIVPPTGCTYIDAVITDKRSVNSHSSNFSSISEGNESLSSPQVTTSDNSGKMCILHAVQLFRGNSFDKNEKKSYFTLTNASTHALSWKVTNGVTMELCIARNWNTLGDINCNVTLFFRGIIPTPNSITVSGGSMISEQIRIFSPLASVEINPTGKFDKWIKVIKPIKTGEISILGERDITFDDVVFYQLVLEYEIDNQEQGISEILPRFKGLQNSLYESCFHSQLYMLYDSDKKYITCGDAFPEKIKISKGKYTLRLQIRHSSINVLERINSLPMLLERTLSGKNSINISCYKDKLDALTDVNKMRTRAIIQGGSLSFFIKDLSPSELPRSSSPGDILEGSITYMKHNTSVVGSQDRPNGYPIKYVIADTKTIEKKDSNKVDKKDDKKEVNKEERKEKDNKDKDKEHNLDNAIKDTKIKWLQGLIGTEDTFMPIYEILKVEFPDNLLIKQYLLQHYIKCKNLKDINTLVSIINAAQSVLSSINHGEVAMNLGINIDKDDTNEVEERKEFELKKTAIIEAYSSIGISTLDLITVSNSVNTGTIDREGVPITTVTIDTTTTPNTIDTGLIETCYTDVSLLNSSFTKLLKDLSKWDDIHTDKHWLLCLNMYKSKLQHGKSLKLINELLIKVTENNAKIDNLSKELLIKERNLVLNKLNWNYILENNKKWVKLTAKNEFCPF